VQLRVQEDKANCKVNSDFPNSFDGMTFPIMVFMLPFVEKRILDGIWENDANK
jgi:hypothetical protein